MRDFYKKDRIPDAPEDLKQYLNAKNKIGRASCRERV